MSSIASLGRMVSGLEAAQKGLAVTGHNISNLNTQGYIRQQLLQHESRYLNIGSGQKLMQVGLGTSLTEIRQIRNELADRRYRTENSIRSYYQTANSVVAEIESILDEPYGEAISKMLSNFWSQAQKLAVNPSGVEERLSFLQSSNVLMKKQNYIMESLQEYQENLNTEVIKTVNRINELAKSIRDYNQEIALLASCLSTCLEYPSVVAFARLFAVTERPLCAAYSPLTPILNSKNDIMFTT
jgi:flagellar hook-associated protein 1 FlgK